MPDSDTATLGDLLTEPQPLDTSAPLGPQIDAIFELREQKRAAETKVDELQALISSKEHGLQLTMEAQGVAGARGRKASAGITESVVPQMEDWDLYTAYIRRHNAFELLERRPAAAAWREHAARRRDKTIPGTVPFHKRKLSIRVIS